MTVPVDIHLVVAVVLLIIGVVGSVTPMVPGPALSVIGVLLYWWSTGYTDPGMLFVAGTVLIGVAAVLVDYFAGAISAKAGGASNMATIAAAVAGFILFFVAGPIGVIVGVAGAVFAVEFYRTHRMEDSATAALYATVGLLASTAVQVLITVTILVGFVLAVIV